MIDTHSQHGKKNRLINIFLFFCCFVFCSVSGEGSVDQEFHSPFNDSDRTSITSIKLRLVGTYGEYRKSYKPGHLHAGIDLEGSFGETVYAIGRGQVQLIFRDFPHKTVIVKHQLPDGKSLYSVYTHVEQVTVDVGDWVDERSPLARLFYEDELKRADFGTPNHLHLEIRKSIADEGRASYASMTRQELDAYCMDPLVFFETHLKN